MSLPNRDPFASKMGERQRHLTSEKSWLGDTQVIRAINARDSLYLAHGPWRCWLGGTQASKTVHAATWPALHHEVALVTSDCGTTRSLGMKWP